VGADSNSGGASAGGFAAGAVMNTSGFVGADLSSGGASAGGFVAGAVMDASSCDEFLVGCCDSAYGRVGLLGAREHCSPADGCVR